MFPGDRRIRESQCDILLAIFQQLISKFLIFQITKKWNSDVGAEAENQKCFAMRCERARENQN